jgi:sterol desaturase/sphingolipid hydroxylase (fatty acid hydroxylase superfamily)
MALVKQLIRVSYVPVMLIGFTSIGTYVVLNEIGFQYLALLLVIAIAISFLAEQVVPYDRDWNKDHRDTWRDRLHFLVNEGANVLSVASLPLIVALLPDFGVWPTDWPLWGQLLLAIIIADCGITMVHYWSHKYEWLWRFHAVHHSVKRMYGFNGLMKHPVHQAIELAGGTLPLILMGIPLDVAALFAFVAAMQLLMQHTNVDVSIGPLRHVLALSPVHRFHHLKWAAEGDVNFGFFTTIWDRMLGTAFYDPDRHFSSDDLGIDDVPDYPSNYLAQLAEPFRRSVTEVPTSIS